MLAENTIDGASVTCTPRDNAVLTAKAAVKRERSRPSASGRKRSLSRYTHTAPAVIPNMATLMTKKARWYHDTTDKSRVCTISRTSVARVRSSTAV